MSIGKLARTGCQFDDQFLTVHDIQDCIMRVGRGHCTHGLCFLGLADCF
jgi:hypothetical protein